MLFEIALAYALCTPTFSSSAAGALARPLAAVSRLDRVARGPLTRTQTARAAYSYVESALDLNALSDCRDTAYALARAARLQRRVSDPTLRHADDLVDTGDLELAARAYDDTYVFQNVDTGLAQVAHGQPRAAIGAIEFVPPSDTNHDRADRDLALDPVSTSALRMLSAGFTTSGAFKCPRSATSARLRNTH